MILRCVSEDIDKLVFRHRAQLPARPQRAAADHEIDAAVEYPRKLELYASNVKRAEQRLPACRALIEINHDIHIAVQISLVVRDGAEQVGMLDAQLGETRLATSNERYGFFPAHPIILAEAPCKVTLGEFGTKRGCTT
jgi:hypothetical protein